MEAYKEEFIEFMVESDVLKFGEFTLKSGRQSPFFMNAGAYVTGDQLHRLGIYYAQAIEQNFGLDFDVVFGPAYKGIPLSVVTAMALNDSFAMPIMRLSSWRIWVTYIAEKPMGCSCLEAGIGTRKARCIPSSLSSLRSGRMRMAIFTRYPPKGSSSRVVTILKRVCMLAICAAGLSGVMDCINPVNGVAMQMHGEQNGAEHVEHQVDDGGALGVAAGADGGQHGGDTGADVLSEEDVYRAVQADYPAEGQRLQDTHRGGGGLDREL